MDLFKQYGGKPYSEEDCKSNYYRSTFYSLKSGF